MLAADRAFSAAAARAPSAADGLAAMFDAEIVAPFPGRGLLVGRDAVAAAFRAAPGFGEPGISWAPVRGGISADGSQGFTFGFLTLAGGDPARRNRKYLAYWVHRPQGWRVVAYRNIPRQPGDVSRAMMTPSLPGFAARERRDARLIETHRASLAAAEHAFSDRAQQVGLRVAFREYGREDAMNMYRGAGFDIGLDAITGNFDAAETVSPVSWSTERSFVASVGRPRRQHRHHPQQPPKRRRATGLLPLLHRVAARRTRRALALYRGMSPKRTRGKTGASPRAPNQNPSLLG